MLYISNFLTNYQRAKPLMTVACTLLLLGGSILQPSLAESQLSQAEVREQAEVQLEVVEHATTIEAMPDFDDRLPYEELRRFAAVFAAIKNRYVEPIDNAKLVDAAINGMLDDLDPHSSYLNEEAFTSLQEATEGTFGGLGIEIDETASKEIEIISPIEDSPAARAGIMPGDVIVKVDGESIVDLPLTEVVKKLRGEPGSSLELSVRRGQEVLDFMIERDLIKVQSVRSKLLDHDIAYIRISQFQERTVEELVKHLNGFKTAPKALVLDVRNDPGGLLNAAVGVTGAFIEPEKLVVYTKSRGEVNLRYRVVPSDYSLNHQDPLKDLPAWSREIPMVVLINVGSASASEIVAGALQDYERATIMGNRSFGKGSVQVVLALGDNTGVKLTIARYYTPKDRSIQATGIEPDIVVTDTENGDFFSTRREADLRDHLSGEEGAVSEDSASVDGAEAADGSEQTDGASEAEVEGAERSELGRDEPSDAVTDRAAESINGNADPKAQGEASETSETTATTLTETAEEAHQTMDSVGLEAVEEIETEQTEDAPKIEMYSFGSAEDYQLQQAVEYLMGEYLDADE